MRPMRTRRHVQSVDAACPYAPTGRRDRRASAATKRARSRPARPPGERDAVRLARRLRSRPPADQRGRAAAVEVDAPCSAPRRPAARELARASGRRRGASGRRRRRRAMRPSREAERGARVAAVGDVGVELARAGGEALGVAARAIHGRAAGDEQRAGLQQVAARRGRRARRAAAIRRAPPCDVHAGADRVPGRVEGHVAAGDAARAHLAERDARRAATKNPPTSASSTPRARAPGRQRAPGRAATRRAARCARRRARRRGPWSRAPSARPTRRRR